MDAHTASELSYKNGYEDGKRDAIKKSEWVTDQDGYHYCKNCGGEMLWYNFYIGPGIEEERVEHALTDFCPKCGADMRNPKNNRSC